MAVEPIDCFAPNASEAVEARVAQALHAEG